MAMYSLTISQQTVEQNLYECLGCGLPVSSNSTNTRDILSPNTLETFTKSNLPLPTLEFGTVSEECQNLSQEISSLEDRISRLQASIVDLSTAKETLIRRLQTYRPLVHPIRRLPDDVLSYIFGICVDTEVEERQKRDSSYCQRYPGSLDTRKAPWILGQICRKWRALSESLPQLWTVVDLDWRYDSLLREYHPAMDRLLSTQLQRCKDQTLTISYCGLEAADPANPLSSNTRLLLILCSRSFQWSKATIRADAVGLLALSSYKEMFPLLNNLHLHLLHPVRPAWIRAAENGVIFDAFHDTPNLRKLTFTGYIDGIRDLSLQLPWSQITHYSVQNDFNWFADHNDHFPLLLHMSNLQYCSLETGIPSTGSMSTPESPVTLPHLHTLVLSHRHIETEESAIDPLLGSLTAPSLRCLRLTCGLDSSSALIAFLRRSECTLHELAIMRAVLDDDALVRLLGSEWFSNVHTLELGGTSPLDLVNISDEVILPLTIHSSNDPVLVPRLRCLVLHDKKAWSDGVFVEMVRSRRRVDGRAVSKLEKVVLQDAVAEGESVIKDTMAKKQLEGLCKEGLVFELRWTADVEEEMYQ